MTGEKREKVCYSAGVSGRTTEPQRKFFSGVGILTVAAVLSKIIGLLYRIPLVRAIGIGGMAYFLAASHIYVTLYLIASAGLPLAVSILVAEREACGDAVGAVKVYRAALLLFLCLGGAGSLFLFFGAEFISARIGLAGAALCLRAIAPTLLFSCVSAAIRGYFQGFQKMAPTAVSEVIESLGKLVFGLLLAHFAVSRGYDKTVCAAFAVTGLTLGVFLSMLYLLVMKLGFSPERALGEHISGRGDNGRPNESSFLRILRIAAPVTCSSLVLSVASVVDTVLISGRLQDAGFDTHIAETMYSSYGNLALPLFNLPASLITPVSLALVPLLSSAFRSGRRGEERTVIASAMRITALLAIPASMGLSVFSEPILTLLYPRETAAVAIAAPLLSILALSVLFSCFMTVTNAILSTYGHPGKALLSMSVGALVKIASEYFLVGNPDTNIYGAPVSTFLCNLIVTSMNLYFVYRYSPGSESISSVFGKPFLASSVGVSLAGGVYVLLSMYGGFAAWKVLLAVLTAALGYLIAAVRSRALRREDVEAIPMGKKLARLLFYEPTGKQKGLSH
ncbi:MAG: polysaccharide biosynthesis protein [Clostridia bacterium]|nr:polysaccharide biosynthesis protein [Clostridia bacterium]